MTVDNEKALPYPLNPCPLSLCHADGKKRSTKKSALKDILLNLAVSLTPQKLQNTSKTAVVVDMMGLLRTLTSLQDTYRDLAELFIKSLPQGYERTDIVADCYCSVKLRHRFSND